MVKQIRAADFGSVPAFVIDRFINCVFTGGQARLYVARIDSAMIEGDEDYTFAPVLQLSMPTEGFVNAALYLEAILKDAVKRGSVQQSSVDEMRAEFSSQFDLLNAKNEEPSDV